MGSLHVLSTSIGLAFCKAGDRSLSAIPFVTGGQKARVVFAELACREPDVLILVSGQS